MYVFFHIFFNYHALFISKQRDHNNKVSSLGFITKNILMLFNPASDGSFIRLKEMDSTP